jgi:RNA polymerase sigma-70 factor (ECF subfamily)
MNGANPCDLNDPASSWAARTVVRYAKQVHRFFLRRLSRPQDVDDLAQEVYLRVLRLEDRPWMENALPYLYTVAASVLADYWHDFSRDQKFVTVDSEAAEHCLEVPGSFSVDELAEVLNLRQQLDYALSKLPPTHQKVLLLHKRDGYSYAEVAQKLDLSIHTVEKYVFQALARMRATPWER